MSGGTANIIYEGGYSTTVVLTDDMLNEYDTMQLGEQDIFVEYGGKKTSFPITVTDISVTSVKITGEGNSLAKGNSMQLKAVEEIFILFGFTKYLFYKISITRAFFSNKKFKI